MEVKVASVLANHLNEIGEKTKMGREFHPTSILEIIKNRNYIGERIVLGKEYRIPAIFEDEEIFNKANEIRVSRRNYRTLKRINVNPFVGIFHCVCGSTIRIRTKPDRTRVGKLSFVCHDSNNVKGKNCKRFGTADYNLICNSVLAFFEKIVNDYDGDKEKIESLQTDLKFKEAELKKVYDSLSTYQENYEDFEYKKGN